MIHEKDHWTTTVLRDGVWYVFCYQCQADIEPLELEEMDDRDEATSDQSDR